MSKADKIFVATCRDIIDNGVWDTALPVRPRWADGTPAHTVKKFGVINRYDLSEEFPIITLRKTNFKAAVDEILWIWQKKSNNVHDLNSRRTRRAPSARRTAISSGSNTSTKRASSTKWTGCFTTSKTTPPRAGS